MNHTPGPWKFEGGEITHGLTTRLVVFREGSRDIAHVIRQGVDEIQGEENAALIASAPDLLAERDRLLLQVGEMRTALEQIATLAIELSDCDGIPGCPAGTMQRTARRVLQQTEKRVGSGPTDRPCCVEAYSRGFEMGKAKEEVSKPNYCPKCGLIGCMDSHDPRFEGGPDLRVM